MSSCYMPYDFKDEVIAAMAETMLDNDKVDPNLRAKIKLFVEANRLSDQMEDLMEGVKSPSYASTATAVNSAPATTVADVSGDDGDDDGGDDS